MSVSMSILGRTVTMKNPELGDAFTLSQKLKVDRAMDGTIYTYNNIPQNQKFTWHFINLTISQAEEIHDFLVATFGQDLTLVDYNNNSYKVRCLTNMLVLTTTGIGKGLTARKEAISTDLQFEVVP